MPHDTANYLANRLLYPYAVPEEKKELALDLEILKAVLKKSSIRYHDSSHKRIFVEQDWLDRYPDIHALGDILIRELKPKDIATLMTKKPVKPIGTVLVPKIHDPKKNILITIGEERRSIKAGQIVFVPTFNRTATVRFSSEGATLLGKKEMALEVAGGPFGLMIDARGES